jgi:hypothetical protein
LIFIVLSIRESSNYFCCSDWLDKKRPLAHPELALSKALGVALNSHLANDHFKVRR